MKSFDLSTFFEMSDEPMCIIAPDGTFVKVNAALELTLGYTGDELRRRSMLELVVEDDQPLAREAVEIIRGGRPLSHVVLRMQAAKGDLRYLSWSCQAVDSHIHAIARDVTDDRHERLRFESLLSAAGIFKDVFDQVGLGFAICDQDGRVVNVNGDFARAVGYPSEGALGRSVQDLIPVASITEDLGLLRDASSQKISHECFYEIEGEISWYLVTISPLRTAAGEFKGYILAQKDITGRRLAEELAALRQSELNVLTNAIPAIIWRSTPTGENEFVNDYWYEMTGLNRDEDFNASWPKALHPDDLEACNQRFATALKTGQKFEMQYRIFSKKMNEYRWYLGRSVPNRDGDGKIVNWFGTAIEIHDQVLAQEQLKRTIEATHQFNSEKTALLAREQAAREASRLKSEFLANMSHEIRTPLNGVVGMTHLLLESKLTKRQQDYAEMIYASSETLMAIINDILDLTKIEAGKLDIEKEPVKLGKLIEETRRSFQVSAKAKGLDFSAVIESPLRKLVFVGDALRVRQVIFNLVQNALKFTESGFVRLKVGLATSGQDLQFSVSDSGIGISSGAQTKIFDAFEQADSSTTRKFGGTGLGLSICKKLVDAMGGRLGVVSEQGLGATFWFEIPLVRIQKSNSESLPKIVSRGGAVQGLRVLVAEDHPTNRKVIGHMLAKEGCRIEFATNGREAVEKALRGRFDLILMDCHMPVMDGFDAAEVISRQPKTAPIVALTADVLRGTRERCLEAGMVGYLTKPVEPEELRQALRTKAGGPRRKSPKKTLQIINRHRLRLIDQINGAGQADLTIELMTDFLRNTPNRIEAMRSALQQGDAARAKFEAHAVKSVANLVGVERFASVCLDLEKKALSKDPAELLAKFSIMDASFAEAKAALEAEIQLRTAAEEPLRKNG